MVALARSMVRLPTRRSRVAAVGLTLALVAAFVAVQSLGSSGGAADSSGAAVALATHGSEATGTAARTTSSSVEPAAPASAGPTAIATAVTTVAATGRASAQPTGGSTGRASPQPTVRSTAQPTVRPTPAPTAVRTATPTPAPTAAPTPPAASSCPVFPASNVWNRDISALPRAANSDTLIAAIGLSAGLHPDFSATGYGIPYNVVGAGTPHVAVSFDYADESDPGPYPIPASPRIEGGSDAHMLMVDTAECRLYELYAAASTGSGWTAGSGAIFDLRSNALRPAGWTSADAAGLPIYPGLVRYDEVARGAILHALRFTAPSTCAGYVYPARHQAGSGSCSTKPPMGLRVRLKSTVDISKFGPQSRVVLRALQRYGMLLADNGSPWYVTGAPDSRWNDDELHALGQIKGSDFEVVDTSGLVNG